MSKFLFRVFYKSTPVVFTLAYFGWLAFNIFLFFGAMGKHDAFNVGNHAQMFDHMMYFDRWWTPIYWGAFILIYGGTVVIMFANLVKESYIKAKEEVAQKQARK